MTFKKSTDIIIISHEIFQKLGSADINFGSRWAKTEKNWHSLTTAVDPVLNNFTSERVTMNSKDFLSRTIIGHDSTAHNSTGKHLARIKFKTTSSEVDRPTI